MRLSQDIDADLFAAECGDVPEIDVHGLRADHVRVEVDRLVHAVFMEGERLGRVIHGRGEGHARRETHAVLRAYQEQNLVESFRDALAPGAAGGVTVFVLHPRHET